MNEHVDFFSLIGVVNVDIQRFVGAVYECPCLLCAVRILCGSSNTFYTINFTLHLNTSKITYAFTS